jgi:dihydrofolate reductase
MNNIAHVVSTTLEQAHWDNSSLIRHDVAEGISKLKQQPGQDILVFGSISLVQSLMAHDLIDEYRLMVFPVVVGQGKRLFGEGTLKKTLKLLETQLFGSSVVLRYAPAREP